MLATFYGGPLPRSRRTVGEHRANAGQSGASRPLSGQDACGPIVIAGGLIVLALGVWLLKSASGDLGLAAGWPSAKQGYDPGCGDGHGAGRPAQLDAEPT